MGGALNRANQFSVRRGQNGEEAATAQVQIDSPARVDRPVGESLPRWRLFLVPACVWLVLLLGCSVTRQVQPTLAATPVPVRTLAPTFTPTPEVIQPLIILTPPQLHTPGVIIVPPGVTPQIVLPPAPTATYTPTPTPVTPTLTPTATDTPTFTPTATATPYVEIESGLVNLRTGPGVAFPLVAQLGPGVPVALVGRNTEGTWYQICCVNNQSVWVAATHVRLFNDVSEVPLISAGSPPTPTYTPTATVTPTATPILYPFELLIGPQFFPTNNEFLTIWVKLSVGPPTEEVAAEGYFLEVKFEGFDRPATNVVRPSFDHFEYSAPQGAGNRVKYNYKYEYRPSNPPRAEYPGATATPSPLQLLGEGQWTIWVKDGAGNQLSNPVTFTTAPYNPNREIYVGWRRVR